MAEKIVMPKAGMAMEKGVIVRWLKEIGDWIDYGELLLEIETDKTSMQVESLAQGYLLAKLFDAGAEVPVVTTIGYLGEKGEVIDEPPVSIESSSKKIPATPLAKRLAKERGVDLHSLSPSGPIRARDIPDCGTGAKMTPLAKRIAANQSLDVQGVQGSGHQGKIFSSDLYESAEKIPLDSMRQTIAGRMLQSHTEIPPVTLHSEAEVTALAAFREKANQIDDRKITFNDLVLKACAIALPEFPGINSSFTAEGIVRKREINIGMAVGLDEGLLVPVVKNANSLSIRGLAAETKRLASGARHKNLRISDLEGGTFTVSNLGMFGITAFTPIINLPETCILGVCAIGKRLALTDNDAVEERQYMGLSLTFDHRALDGAYAARFLQRIVQLLENPIALAL